MKKLFLIQSAKKSKSTPEGSEAYNGLKHELMKLCSQNKLMKPINVEIIRFAFITKIKE